MPPLINYYASKTNMLGYRYLHNNFKKRIIILTNVFGNEGASRILFHKSEDKYYGYVKTFLIYLNALPTKIPEVDLETIATDHRIEKNLEELI